MSFRSVNPATGEEIATYEAMSDEEVENALQAAQATFEEWSRVEFEERGRLLRRAGELLRDRRDQYGELMAKEMGKPLSQGVAEAEKCAWVCDFYADNGAAFLADEAVDTDAQESFVSYQPLGVVLAVMPWNYPFWQVLRFAAPALMAGNAAVLKHASNVLGCALAIEEVFRDAGFPPDLFRTLIISHKQTEDVIKHAKVRAVTLTGSVGAGRAIAAQAGKALKKTVLELGGSDPYVILADADLDRAVEACVNSRLTNSGQSCIAAKRFVVVRDVLEEFQQRFVDEMTARRMGDPLEGGVDVGPQARWDLRDELHEQVTGSIDAGATCLLGGEVPDDPGAYYPPTVLSEVAPGMPAYSEEMFGPVAAIIPVEDEAEAIRVANDSDFGLGAAVFSKDVEKARTIARTELNAGCCFVNEYVRSDPRLPFGGVKDSGYGRELAAFGIKEFVNAKSVWVA